MMLSYYETKTKTKLEQFDGGSALIKKPKAFC